MSIKDALSTACRESAITVPKYTKPGEWVRCPAEGKPPSNKSGAVLLFDDGTGGICYNWITGHQQVFRTDGAQSAKGGLAPRQRDLDADRRIEQEQAEAARISAAIVRAATPRAHPYLEAKGFPDEVGLVLDDLRPLIPGHNLGHDIAVRLPQGAGPWLIVPGRIGKDIATVQVIGPDGEKKNIYRGKMKGAAHRIATGAETWVCEGFATALSVRAALRLLGRSATVYSAFSAANVAAVASGISGARIAADHDRPLEQLHGKGTGEFYASQTGRQWVMPSDFGDFNDMHQREGLRAVALALREVG